MRIRLAVWGRTAIYLHAGSIFFAGYMVFLGYGKLLLVSMLSILLHEFAHAGTALAAGYRPLEIEITPMGAMLRLEQEHTLRDGWWLMIYLAGPVVTLILCWAGILLAKYGIASLDTCRMIFLCNLALLCMNLLPSMPLDGGNMLLLLLKRYLGDAMACNVMRVISSLCGVICIGLNLWLTWRQGGWNFSLACAGCFMIYAGTTSVRTNALHELQRFMDRKIRLERRLALPVHGLTVMDNVALRKAVLMLHPRKYTQLWVVGYDTRLRGCIMENQLIEAYLRNPGECVASIVRSEGEAESIDHRIGRQPELRQNNGL